MATLELGDEEMPPPPFVAALSDDVLKSLPPEVGAAVRRMLESRLMWRRLAFRWNAECAEARGELAQVRTQPPLPKELEMATNEEIIAGYLRHLAADCQTGADDLSRLGHNDMVGGAEERARLIKKLADAVENGLLDKI